MRAPPTHYAHSGEASIAYQMLGDGPCDLVVINGPASHLEIMWEEPRTARASGSSAKFARLIMFDRRGTGLSDPVFEPPTLEQQVDDMRAVLAAVGSERIVADRRQSTSGSRPCSRPLIPTRSPAWCSPGVAADGAHMVGGRPASLCVEAIESGWGDGTLVALYAPSQVGNQEFVEWWGRMQRSALSPGMARG